MNNENPILSLPDSTKITTLNYKEAGADKSADLKQLLDSKLQVEDIYTDAQIDQFIANESTNIMSTLTPIISAKLDSSQYNPSQFATRADPTLT